jgi:WD40 repeat protein
LANADGLDEVKALLCNYDWVSGKLRATSISATLDDYELVIQDRDLALIQQALRLSIPALARDRSQMRSQLLGRLRGTDSLAVKTLVVGAKKGPGRAWLCPRFPSLTPPGGALRQILLGHKGSINAVAFHPDGSRALSGAADNALRLWDLSTGACLSEYNADAPIGCVAFARDDLIVAGSADGRIHILEIREA